MTEVVCMRCAHPNSKASNYCSSCGFDLHRSVEEPTTEHAIVSTPADNDGNRDEGEPKGVALSESGDPVPSQSGGDSTTASFVVKRGAIAGSRYLVVDEFTTIGRHPESSIFLDDVTVSRRHAEVHREGEAILLNDVGSLNGTYLNRKRIESASLRTGDEVQIGKFKLVFLTDDS